MTGENLLLAAFTVAVVFAFVLLVAPAILNVMLRLLNKMFGERR